MTFHRAPFLSVVAALSLAPMLAHAQGAFQVGEPLPTLRLPEVGGERTIDLSEFRGRKLVLFEFAAW